MAETNPRKTTAALRWCGACCLSFARWTLWLLLLVSLGLLTYVAAVREIAVPGFLLRRAEQQLARFNLRAETGRATLTPRGQIVVENLRLHAGVFAEPLLTARTARLHVDFWSLAVGGLTLHEVEVEGAALQLPAMVSPTGAVEPVVRDLAGTLRRDGPHWRVAQLAFRLGAARVTAQGALWPPAATGATPDWSQLVAQTVRAGRAALVQLRRLDACEGVNLAAAITPLENHTHRVDLLLTAAKIRVAAPAPITAAQVAATATVFPGGARAAQFHAHVAARDLELPGGLGAGRAHAQVRFHLPAGWAAPAAEELHLALSDLANDQEPFGSPVLSADLRAWPQLRAHAALTVRRELLVAAVEANLREQAGRLRVAGRLLPDMVNGHLEKNFPRTAAWLQIREPGRIDATVSLAPGWKFAGLDSRVAAGRLDFRGVSISSAHGRLQFDGRELLASDAVLRLGDHFARGTYWQDVKSRDYRMLLEGRLAPMRIAPWFRADGWWPRLWADFDFAAAAPVANVDLTGRWGDGTGTTFVGRARVAQPRIRRVDFDTVDAVVFARGGFTRGLLVDAARAGGAQSVRGSFDVWRGRPERRDSLGLDVEGQLDAPALAGLIGKPAENFLGDWRFDRPPRLAVQGRIGLGGYLGETSYRFRGASDGPVRYRHFPLDGVRAEGGVTGADFRVDQLAFALGGGEGAGKLSLGGPEGARQLGFDLYLKDAELTRVILATEEFSRQGAPGSSELKDSRFMKRAAGGKLELALSALGEPGELASFRGSGNARITGAELGEIHLFGLLSQVLSGLSLNFSSLKLDQAQSSLQLADGVVGLPDVRISGPAALIEGRGNYRLSGGALDFTAKFKPFDRTKTLLQDALSLVFNPLTSIVELKLGGQLKDPKWSYSLGESKPRDAAPVSPAGDDRPKSPQQ